jgi:hypothetical protein
MVIPKGAIRSLHSLPQEISEKLPPDMSIHGLLAVDVALGQIPAPWRSVLPRLSEFEASVPFLWPAELQELLPSPARQLLAKQQEKFNQLWEMLGSFPAIIDRREFVHAWFLINTRTFYYESPETQLYPWEDRLALLPVADLFNHAQTGCHVSFTSECYSVTADRAYEAGEEVYISYGDHSNDFLLAEYGFTLSENRWDKACLDDVILPKLSQKQREVLERRDILGGYMVQRKTGDYGPCARAKAALRVLCSSSTGDDDEWLSALDRIGDESTTAGGCEDIEAIEMKEFKGLAQEFRMECENKVAALEQMHAGSESQRSVLLLRWKQIVSILEQCL